MPASESRVQAITTLHTIWTARDIAAIPEKELNRLSTPVLLYLVRWWSHQHRWWDQQSAPTFTEDPPGGFLKTVSKVDPAKPVSTGEPTPLPSANYGRQFKGTLGGVLTSRQAEKHY